MESYAFSPNASELAVTTNDGRLLIWDVTNQKLRSQFVPSSHLAAACTCVRWVPQGGGSQSHRGKKRKSSGTTNGVSGSSDTVALGTTAGSILLFSLKTNDLVKTLSEGHTEQVNDVQFNDSGSEVFSCSNDGQVAQFDVHKTVRLSRFKAGGKGERLYSLLTLPDGRLLTASSKIRLWGLSGKGTWDLQQTFSGHTGEVTGLVLVRPSLPTADSFFVMSSSASDRVVSVWNVLPPSTMNGHGAENNNAETAVANLAVNDAVQSVACSGVLADDKVVAAVVTKTGSLVCFDHDLSSKRRKKPVKPKKTVQIATEKDSSGKVLPISILNCRITEELHLILSHGSHVKPAFEDLEYDSLAKTTCLVRSVQTVKPEDVSAGNSKFIVPDTNDVTVLAPGPTLRNEKTTKRKASSSGKVDALPMEDRLRLLSHDGEAAKTTPPRTDSLLQLLLQGLHNKDPKILASVLDRADESLIENTVRKLPIEAIVPLVQELQHYIKGRGMVHQSHAKWLRSVLQNHTAYLMSTPHCVEMLGPIYAMLEARTRHYSKVMQMKGKLDLMTKQITGKVEEQSEGVEVNKEALLVYQDESSDELSDVLDELLPPASDTDDNWDDDDNEEDDKSEESEESDDDIELVNGDAADDVEMESD